MLMPKTRVLLVLNFAIPAWYAVNSCVQPPVNMNREKCHHDHVLSFVIGQRVLLAVRAVQREVRRSVANLQALRERDLGLLRNQAGNANRGKSRSCVKPHG